MKHILIVCVFNIRIARSLCATAVCDDIDVIIRQRVIDFLPGNILPGDIENYHTVDILSQAAIRSEQLVGL